MISSYLTLIKVLPISRWIKIRERSGIWNGKRLGAVCLRGQHFAVVHLLNVSCASDKPICTCSCLWNRASHCYKMPSIWSLDVMSASGIMPRRYHSWNGFIKAELNIWYWSLWSFAVTELWRLKSISLGSAGNPAFSLWVTRCNCRLLCTDSLKVNGC